MIIVDSREKPKAIKSILSYFDKQGIGYRVSKLIVGDYQRFDNPAVAIDRKKDIQEWANCCTTDKERFIREMGLAQELGVKLYVLITQNTIDGGAIKALSDLMLWRSKYSHINSERIYRVSAYWENKHGIKILFCDKRQAGAVICELLNVDMKERKKTK